MMENYRWARKNIRGCWLLQEGTYLIWKWTWFLNNSHFTKNIYQWLEFYNRLHNFTCFIFLNLTSWTLQFLNYEFEECSCYTQSSKKLGNNVASILIYSVSLSSHDHGLKSIWKLKVRCQQEACSNIKLVYMKKLLVSTYWYSAMVPLWYLIYTEKELIDSPRMILIKQLYLGILCFRLGPEIQKPSLFHFFCLRSSIAISNEKYDESSATNILPQGS
jgi:hypothetical protein